MVTLGCSASLLDAIPIATTLEARSPGSDDSVLGGWYAGFLKIRRTELVQCTNAATLLTVYLTAAQADTFLPRLRALVLDVLSIIQVPEPGLEMEARALHDWHVVQGIPRSVGGSMNAFMARSKAAIEEAPGISTLALTTALVDIPWKPLGFRSARELVKEAFERRLTTA